VLCIEKEKETKLEKIWGEKIGSSISWAWKFFLNNKKMQNEIFNLSKCFTFLS